jgi:hypothetical protein
VAEPAGITEPNARRRRSIGRENYVMGSTIPFSKYTADFNADLMEAMRAAFCRVCDILRLPGERGDPLMEIVVEKIVELAKAGERDPEIMCIDVLAQLEMTAQSEARAPSEQAPHTDNRGVRAGLRGKLVGWGWRSPKHASRNSHKLSKEINAALGDPQVKARFADLGATVLPGSPTDFGHFVADEIEKWSKVVRFAGIKAE